MHPKVGPSPTWISRVRGCFILSIEALLCCLQLNGSHLALKSQKSQYLHMFLLITFLSHVGP